MKIAVIWLFLIIIVAGGCITAPAPQEKTLHLTKKKSGGSAQFTRQLFVLIDPGHGGSDTGAIGKNGVLEKSLNLELSIAIKNELKKHGFQVALTRKHDVKLSLKEREDIINNYYPDLVISVHHNSCNNPKVSGVETFYFLPFGPTKIGFISYQYAHKVQAALHEATVSPNRGVKSANFRLLRNSVVPAILIEAGFISNKSESIACSSVKRQKKVAKEIAKSLAAVYDSKRKFKGRN